MAATSTFIGPGGDGGGGGYFTGSGGGSGSYISNSNGVVDIAAGGGGGASLTRSPFASSRDATATGMSSSWLCSTDVRQRTARAASRRTTARVAPQGLPRLAAKEATV